MVHNEKLTRPWLSLLEPHPLFTLRARNFARIKQCLPEWQCVSAQLNEEETAICPISTSPALAIIYARKEEKNTLAICEQLRYSPESSAAAILLVISRHQISQGNVVKRMGNAAFIMVPFNEKGLRDKCTRLLESSSSLMGGGKNDYASKSLPQLQSRTRKCSGALLSDVRRCSEQEYPCTNAALY